MFLSELLTLSRLGSSFLGGIWGFILMSCGVYTCGRSWSSFNKYGPNKIFQLHISGVKSIRAGLDYVLLQILSGMSQEKGV